MEQLYTQPAVNGDKKTTQLLLECCPKAHLGRSGGNTKGERHEQIPLVFRARKMKTHFLPQCRNTVYPDTVKRVTV